MNLRLKKTIAAVAIVLTAGTTLAACGGDDSSDAKGDSSSVGEKASTELTKDNFFTEVAKAQQEARTSHVETKIGMSGQQLEGSGDVAVGENPEDTSMTLTFSMGQQGSLDMRLVDKVLYLNLGPATQNKFAKVDLSDEDSPAGKQFGALLENVDPSKQLEQLQGAITRFEKKGAAEKLDGVEATPYEVAVDSQKVIDSLGAAGAGASAQLPDEIVYTMYVGPDNLPRRLTTEVAGATTTIDYSKWGEKVEIEAPAADQISDVDLSKMGAGVS
jgi:hypothetical protein